MPNNNFNIHTDCCFSHNVIYSNNCWDHILLQLPEEAKRLCTKACFELQGL